LINERQEFGCGVLVAVVDSAQDSRDVGHGSHNTTWRHRLLLACGRP
jgi:hypothetical protein